MTAFGAAVLYFGGINTYDTKLNMNQGNVDTNCRCKCCCDIYITYWITVAK